MIVNYDRQNIFIVLDTDLMVLHFLAIFAFFSLPVPAAEARFEPLTFGWRGERSAIVPPPPAIIFHFLSEKFPPFSAT